MDRSHFASRRLATLLSASLLLLGAGGMGTLAGCSGFGTYDPNDPHRDYADLPNPNQPNMQRVITASLRYVLDRYRQGGKEQPIAINLPPGMRRSNYEIVASQVGPNVHPLTPEIANTQSMPIYHVGAIELSGNRARVSIFRPTTEIEPDPRTGRPVYQMFSVRLDGGFQQWRAVYAQSYHPGAFEPPTFYALPDVDDAFQFENWKKAQRDLAIARERSNLDGRIEKMPRGDMSGIPTPPPAREVDAAEAQADEEASAQPRDQDQADGQPAQPTPDSPR